MNDILSANPSTKPAYDDGMADYGMIPDGAHLLIFLFDY